MAESCEVILFPSHPVIGMVINVSTFWVLFQLTNRSAELVRFAGVAGVDVEASNICVPETFAHAHHRAGLKISAFQL